MIKVIQSMILAVSLFLSLFLGLNADGLKATVNDTVTTETEVITVTVKNETRGCTEHSGILVTELEQKLDGEWKTIGRVGAIPEVSMILYPTFKTTETFNIKRFGIDSLSVGEYRFVVPYSLDTDRIAYAYFTVTE